MEFKNVDFSVGLRAPLQWTLTLLLGLMVQSSFAVETQVLNGLWQSSAGRYSYDEKNPRYEFTVRSATIVDISLESLSDTCNDLPDPYLFLLDGKGNEITSNDDRQKYKPEDIKRANRCGLNSYIRKVPLEAGTYQLVAATYASGQKGRFKISLRGYATHDFILMTVPVEALENSWQSSAGKDSSDAKNPRYEFTVRSATVADISLESLSDTCNIFPDPDPYLYLLDGQGNEITSNDDRQKYKREDIKVANRCGLNAYIRKVPLEAGTYQLVAATYASGQRGRFKISLKAEGVSNFLVQGDTVYLAADESAPTNDNDQIAGNWRLAPEAGALGVGPNQGEMDWWLTSLDDVYIRACLFDDVYALNTDGSMSNIQGAETWLESWQGAAEGCGAPIAPHDGSNAATYSYDATAGTLTIVGQGAFMGLARVTNQGEDGVATDNTIVYRVSELTATTMTLDLNFGNWYRFKFVNEDYVAPAPSSTVSVTFQVNMNGVDTANGVSVMGGDVFGWAGLAMSDDDADGIYTVTTDLNVNTDVLFKYRSSNDATWDNQESVGAGCANGDWGDRLVSVGEEDITLGVAVFGICTDVAAEPVSNSI